MQASKGIGSGSPGQRLRTFPRVKSIINGVYYRGLSLTCEAAATITLSKKDGICFVRIPFENDTYHAPASIIDKQNEKIVDTPLFTLRTSVFSSSLFLQNRDYRVWSASRFLGCL